MISARRQGIFAEQRLYGLSVWTRQPIGELNVPRRNRSDTRRSRMLWIGSWRRFFGFRNCSLPKRNLFLCSNVLVNVCRQSFTLPVTWTQSKDLACTKIFVDILRKLSYKQDKLHTPETNHPAAGHRNTLSSQGFYV
jgi:hypothetical protein